MAAPIGAKFCTMVQIGFRQVSAFGAVPQGIPKSDFFWPKLRPFNREYLENGK